MSATVADAPPVQHRFNSETARAAALKRHHSPQEPRTTPADKPTQQSPAQPATQNTEDYCNVRLEAVRAQIRRLDTLIAKETDPNKLDRLFSAAAKAGELERQYAGRPLPGSLRPNATPKRTMFDAQPTARATPAALEQPTTSETERAEQE